MNRHNSVPQAAPNSCGKSPFSGRRGQGGRLHWPVCTFRSGLVLRSVPGPVWEEDQGLFHSSCIFSVDVLLQLNISTRLSVGSSRSVIYSTLLIVNCGWIGISVSSLFGPETCWTCLQLQNKSFLLLICRLTTGLQTEKRTNSLHHLSLVTHSQFQFPL